jgi:hypothetical protein
MKTSQDIVFKVKSIIYGHGRGWCFTQNDFLAIGHEEAIRQCLSRLEKASFIRRIAWGLYEYPRKHLMLGLLPPEIQQIVKAYARKHKISVLPSGAMAANLLGLSTQVPAKVVYLTEGFSKRLTIGKQEIVFKKTTPKIMVTTDTFAGLVIQALKHLGADHIDAVVLAKLKKNRSKDDLRSLQKYRPYAPAWIQKILLVIIKDESHG